MVTSHSIDMDLTSFDHVPLIDLTFVSHRGLAWIRLDVIPAQTASPSQATMVNAQLPPSRDRRFSFSDMMSRLDDVGLAAFNHRGNILDSELRQRHDRREVSSLYFYRCLARMTQEQLAVNANSRQSFISQLEQRRRPLTWKQASKLANVLGVRPEQLMEST